MSDKYDHDSDSEASYDSDDMQDNNIEEETHKEINKIEQIVQKINSNDKINITTEGVSQDEFPNVKFDKMKNVKQCNYCAKWYQHELIINNEEGQLCKHCLFWINYDLSNRLSFDEKCAKQGFGIAEYILECSEIHDVQKCTRNSAGCLLCDFKSGIHIENILNSEMLPLQSNNNTKKHEDDEDMIVAEFNDASKTNFKVPVKLVL